MYEITIERSQGYTGKTAKNEKGYVARITGTDGTYGLHREFCDSEKSTDNARFRRSRATWTDRYLVDTGIYEWSEGGEVGYAWVWIAKSGDHAAVAFPADRVAAMAAHMDAGMTTDEARIATRPVST
jgi:hypothetical protein